MCLVKMKDEEDRRRSCGGACEGEGTVRTDGEPVADWFHWDR